MHYIDSAVIHGFWGSKDVRISFHRDLNFLIGNNGSGKTTIINLISAALRGDIPALYSNQFNKITIKLKSRDSRKKPVVEILKIIDEDMGSIALNYKIKLHATDQGSSFGVGGPLDERLYRESRSVSTRRMTELGARLNSILSELVEVNWLSIHRTASVKAARVQREESFETTVDHKIADISRKASSYFSLLSSKAEEETKNFQEAMFLSLLEQEKALGSVFGGDVPGSGVGAPIFGGVRSGLRPPRRAA